MKQGDREEDMKGEETEEEDDGEEGGGGGPEVRAGKLNT